MVEEMTALKGDLMDKLGLGGWNEIENAPELAKEQQEAAHAKQLEAAKIVSRAMLTSEGQAFMNWLKMKTVDLPCFVAGQHAAEQGFTREGQNSIYREIKRLIKIARDG